MVNSVPVKCGYSFIELVQSSTLSSIAINSGNIQDVKRIASVIFVGSSLVGKSTLIDQMRCAIGADENLAPHFQIPKRVITRPQRANDNTTENQFVSVSEFDEMIRCGQIGLHWIRKMEAERTEQYGFLNTDNGKIPVFSGNNAIVDNQLSVMPFDLLDQSLVVAVYCPDDLREERMRQRSPDLVSDKPQEAKYRMSDKAANVCSKAHMVIKNFGSYQDSAKADVVSLLFLLKAAKSIQS